MTALSRIIAAAPVRPDARVARARRHADLTHCLAFAAECAGELSRAGRLAQEATDLAARADKLSRETGARRGRAC